MRINSIELGLKHIRISLPLDRVGPQAILPRARAAACRAQGASPRARGPPVDFGDKLPPMPVVHFLRRRAGT